MGYILKNTDGLLNTRITDVGRRAISRGNFNISYFQVGDSEVDYITTGITNNNILIPSFPAHNDTAGGLNINKQNVKYPYYLTGFSGTTYGIPYSDANVQEFYNLASDKGFFVSGSSAYSAQTTSAYTVTSNYRVIMPTLSGQTGVTLTESICSSSAGVPKVGDFATFIFDGVGGCGPINNSFPILTYKIQAVSGTAPNFTIGLDRKVPIYTANTTSTNYARCLIYPSGMTVMYDTITAEPNWNVDVFNFETVCDVASGDTKVWNMNIPWSQTVAGVGTTYEDYNQYGSYFYLGTKEYLYSVSGQTITGQTNFDLFGSVFHYNSNLKKVIVEPNEQKSIAIIHYTNQSIDNVYGEKFSSMPYDPNDASNLYNLARFFKLTIPTLMWHKSSGATIGQSFYMDPPSKLGELCEPYYVKSTKNEDMNQPGIRFYNLWDDNLNSKGNLNRVGRVFPDSHLIVIDDDELIAALSYKSNRNWTLPAPDVSLVQPNVCDNDPTDDVGVLTGGNQTMWVTYRLDSTGFTNSLHCNYYTKVVGPDTGCTISAQNVSIKFGDEFPFLYTNVSLSGFSANEIKILAQRTQTGSLPIPNAWKLINVTSKVASSKVNGFIPKAALTSNTFFITESNYSEATTYDLSNFIDIPTRLQPDKLNFGDEYYFYGNIETGIAATIYEMSYKVNLVDTQFQNTSNPTYITGKDKYISEVGLYNSNKELMVISKLQSPFKRTANQQINVTLDF